MNYMETTIQDAVDGKLLPPGFTKEDLARFMEEKKTRPHMHEAMALLASVLIAEVECLTGEGRILDAMLFKSDDQLAWTKLVRCMLMATMPDEIKAVVEAARTKH